jgi:hypothetical protein
MKQIDIIKVLAVDLGTKDVAELNKLLKAKDYPETKYRITGESLGHYGFTGVIKNITADGLKVFNANKVSLIRYTEMESFEKAKPREARPERPKEVVEKVEATKKVRKPKTDDDDAYGELIRREPVRGSRFIPKPRK